MEKNIIKWKDKLMTFMNILKKLSILVAALLALGLTRMGIGYLTILIAIGIIMPIICGSKKSAVFTGILYATISYILTYPSGTFLINYMPTESIPITVSTSTTYTNLFLVWIIPVIIAIAVCGIFSILGYTIYKAVFGKDEKKTTEGYYFEKSNDSNPKETYLSDDDTIYPESTFSPKYEQNYPNDYSSKNNHNYSRNNHSSKNNKKYPRSTKSLNKSQKKELLYLTPIQKAKNRNKRENE